MIIQLTQEQIATLQRQVDAGDYTSVEVALDCIIASSELDDDIDEWAAPLVAEGLADIEAGRVSPAEDVFARLEAKLKASAG